MKGKRVMVGTAALLALTIGVLGLAAMPAAAQSGALDCTINGAGSHGTLQDAIDNAGTDDTIACEGATNEGVVVNKSVTITAKSGEDAFALNGGNTIETGINVTTGSVTIEKVVVEDYTEYGILVHPADSNPVIEGVTIRQSAINTSGNGTGVVAPGQTMVDGVTIEESILDEHAYGAVQLRTDGEGVIQNVQIGSNVLASNSGRGVNIESNGAVINGVTLQEVSLEDNVYGLRADAYAGAQVNGLSATQIAAMRNERKGVYLRADGENAVISDATLQQSLINDTQGVQGEPSAGVYLHALNDGFLGEVTITENAIIDNVVGVEVDTEGVEAGTPGTLGTHQIQRNIIDGNDAGVVSLNSDRFVDATLNYWGDSSGPASPGSTILYDPVTGVMADGTGDTVSETPNSEFEGQSNVNFAPTIGGKSDCSDNSQLHDLVPDEQRQDQLGISVDDFAWEVEGISVDGPLTDFVGLCLWDRSVLPFRADDSNAATTVQGPDVLVREEGTDVSLNRDRIAVYDQGAQVDFSWEPDTQGAKDNAFFANQDAQFVVAKLTGEGSGDLSVTTDAESGDVTVGSGEFEVVDVQETAFDSNSDLTTPVSYEATHGDGVYVTMLVTDRTGDGIQHPSGDLSFNAHESDLTIVGLEAIAVQTAAGTIDGAPDTVTRGDEVTFDVNANLGESDGVEHAVVVFDKDAMTTSTATITDWTVDMGSEGLTEAEFLVDVKVGETTETVTVTASDLLFQGGTLTGTVIRDGEEETFEFENGLLDGLVVFEGDPPMVDGAVANTTGGDDAALTIPTGDEWATGTYQYAYIAGTEDGRFSTTAGTFQMESDTDGGGGAPPTGPGPSPPPSQPPAPAEPSPVVNKTGGDNVTITIPSEASRNFTFECPLTNAQMASGISISQISARSTVDQEITVTLDTATKPPAPSRPLDEPYTGGLFVDINYDVDPSVWTSSTFEWQIDRDRYPNSDPADFSLFRYNESTDEWETIDTELVDETADHYQFRSEADGFSVYAVGATQPESALQVTDASLSDTEISVGDSVDVEATVENQGNETGELDIELLVDGEVVDTETVELDGGESTTVSFTETFEEAGSYDIAVNDVDAGTLEVTEATTATATETPGEPGGGGNALWYVIAIVLLLAAAGAAYYFLYYREGEQPF